MAAPVTQILEAGDYAQQVRRAVELLGAGKIVVLPTETVYGATGLLRASVAERLKGLRLGSTTRPLTPHVAGKQQAEQFLGKPTELAERMMRKLWPGPVGLQFDVQPQQRRETAAKLGLAESDLYDGPSITLRCPDHPLFLDVVSAMQALLAATAVGQPGRFDAPELAAALDGKVDLILDAGPTRFSKPSTLVKVLEDGYHIVRAGVYDERTIRRLLRTMILFVCSGNTCRSPMAEAIARKLLSERLGVDEAALEKRGIEVFSAGSHAMAGARATPEAVEAAKTVGADLSRHRSRPLTVELINQADVIFTMDRNHTRAATSMVPSAQPKVKALDPAAEIEDPIGGDAALYHDLAGRLWKLIDARLSEESLP